MEQRNVSLENRLRKGGVAVAEEPVLRYEVQQQSVQSEQQQQQLIRMQELVNEYQQQQLQQHSSQQQQQQREHALETKLHEANVALLVAQQQHQQECRHFQQQIFAAEDAARSSSFSTSQAQGLLEQARDRVRAFEADVKRLEATVHEQEQHIQKQQQQTRAKVFQTIAVQTAYSSPVVLDDQHRVAQSPISSMAAADMPQQVATPCVLISSFM
jgi:predicted  nucleic acid-binding Zn-ribbon protein